MPDGTFQMNGPLVEVVGSDSATHVRPWDDASQSIQAIRRTHSEMVKYSRYDEYGDIVIHCVREMCQSALARAQRGALHHGTGKSFASDVYLTETNPTNDSPANAQIGHDPVAMITDQPPRNSRAEAANRSTVTRADVGVEARVTLPTLGADEQLALDRQLYTAVSYGNIQGVVNAHNSGANISGQKTSPWDPPTALAKAAHCYSNIKTTLERFPNQTGSYLHDGMARYVQIIRYLLSNNANFERESGETQARVRQALREGG